MATAVSTFDLLRTKEGIHNVLNNPNGKTGSHLNSNIIFKMLQKMYAYQTMDEQSQFKTSHVNGVGFNKFDAPFLSDVAKKSRGYGRLTPRQAEVVANVLHKYVGQLAQIANDGVAETAAAVEAKIETEEEKVPVSLESSQQEEVATETKPKTPRPKKAHVRKFSEKKALRYAAKVNGVGGLIQESENAWYYLISFAEENLALFERDLLAIPECSMWSRKPVEQAAGQSAAVSEAWRQIWRVRKTDETLKLISVFGKKFKFDFVGDILMQAQLSTSEAKELERLSYARSCSTLRLPKLPTWSKKEWEKYQLPGPYVKALKPLPYQIAGANYALRVKRTFIADEMGLGKTIQALLTIRLSKKMPWLIVCPAAVKINWYRETRKWLGKSVHIGICDNKTTPPLVARQGKPPYTDNDKKKLLRVGKKWLSSRDIVIVNYDRFHKYIEQLKQLKWEGVVFDESHYCKGRSQRSRTAVDFAHTIEAEFALNLTGTPAMNNPSDLIRQLQMIGKLSDFGGPVHFLNRHCSVVNVDMSKLPKLPKMDDNGTLIQEAEDISLRDHLLRKAYENQMVLNTQLRSTCYIRREKADVLASLPDKTRTTILLDINNRKEYERAERDVVSFLMDRVTKDEKFMKKISKLSKEDQVRQIKERRAEVSYISARAEALRRIEVCKQIAAVGKLDGVREWLEDALENGVCPVVFAHHLSILNELETFFPDCSVSIRGGMSDNARQAAIDKFQNDKKIKVFIGSLKAAGIGITLTKSDTPVFLELGWNPAVHDQAEDRCHRIGQKNAVNAYYLIAKGTIEERIARLIERKRNLVDATTVGDPISKSREVGSILGDLIEELTGKSAAI